MKNDHHVPSMWIGGKSQSCVSVCNVEKLAVLPHIPYQHFEPPDPQKVLGARNFSQVQK